MSEPARLTWLTIVRRKGAAEAADTVWSGKGGLRSRLYDFGNDGSAGRTATTPETANFTHAGRRIGRWPAVRGSRACT